MNTAQAVLNLTSLTSQKSGLLGQDQQSSEAAVSHDSTISDLPDKVSPVSGTTLQSDTSSSVPRDTCRSDPLMSTDTINTKNSNQDYAASANTTASFSTLTSSGATFLTSSPTTSCATVGKSVKPQTTAKPIITLHLTAAPDGGEKLADGSTKPVYTITVERPIVKPKQKTPSAKTPKEKNCEKKCNGNI